VRLPALALAVVALACVGPKHPRTGERSMTEDPETHVALEWSMAIENGALVVDFELTNKRDRRIYVPETLLVPGEKDRAYNRAPGRVVVSAREGGLAALSYGVAGATHPIAWIVPPLVRPLEPGQSYKQRFVLGLPLSTWHNVGYAAPFTSPPTRVALAVWFLTEEPQWHDLKTDADEPLRVPLRGEPRWIRGEPRPLPEA
jgi:hypothetical protein